MDIKKDVMTAWNEADEILQDLLCFNDEELLDNRQIIKKRVEIIMNSLEKHFTTEEFRIFTGD